MMIFHWIELNFHSNCISNLMKHHCRLFLSNGSQIYATNVEKLISNLNMVKNIKEIKLTGFSQTLIFEDMRNRMNYNLPAVQLGMQGYSLTLRQRILPFCLFPRYLRLW